MLGSVNAVIYNNPYRRRDTISGIIATPGVAAGTSDCSENVNEYCRVPASSSIKRASE